MSKRKRYAAEEIIAKLREAEVHLAQGDTVGQAVRKRGVSEQTYYRWRREYGGMRVDQAKRLKELERENRRNDVGRWHTHGQHSKSRNNAPVASSDRQGRRSATFPASPRMSEHWSHGWWRWLPASAATATGG